MFRSTRTDLASFSLSDRRAAPHSRAHQYRLMAVSAVIQSAARLERGRTLNNVVIIHGSGWTQLDQIWARGREGGREGRGEGRGGRGGEGGGRAGQGRGGRGGEGGEGQGRAGQGRGGEGGEGGEGGRGGEGRGGEGGRGRGWEGRGGDGTVHTFHKPEPL